MKTRLLDIDDVNPITKRDIFSRWLAWLVIGQITFIDTTYNGKKLVLKKILTTSYSH